MRMSYTLPLVSEPPHGGEDLTEGDLLGEHLDGACTKHLLVNRGVLQSGHHQHWDRGVGIVQIPDHLWCAFVGEGYVHYGCVYAPLGHPAAPLGHGAALGHHVEVWLLVYQIGGSLAEGAVILHEQDERHGLASVHLIPHSYQHTYPRGFRRTPS